MDYGIDEIIKGMKPLTDAWQFFKLPDGVVERKNAFWHDTDGKPLYLTFSKMPYVSHRNVKSQKADIDMIDRIKYQLKGAHFVSAFFHKTKDAETHEDFLKIYNREWAGSKIKGEEFFKTWFLVELEEREQELNEYFKNSKGGRDGRILEIMHNFKKFVTNKAIDSTNDNNDADAFSVDAYLKELKEIDPRAKKRIFDNDEDYNRLVSYSDHFFKTGEIPMGIKPIKNVRKYESVTKVYTIYGNIKRNHFTDLVFSELAKFMKAVFFALKDDDLTTIETSLSNKRN